MKNLPPLPTRLALIFLACCAMAACGPATPTATALAPETATHTAPAPTRTSHPTQVEATATARTFVGILSTQLHVRAGPSSTTTSLGLLAGGTDVSVVATSPDGNWFQLLYPASPDGLGWVAAAYVTFASGTPYFPSATPGGPSGRVLIRLNVRTGPGTSFESLGMLEPETQVVLTAKNLLGSWFQIEYPPGSGERGWVTAQYIQTDQSSRLPILDEFGQPQITGTPGPSTPLISATPTPAVSDGDSHELPAIRVLLSSEGTRRFDYSSGLSTPPGDSDDWVEFSPFATLPGNPARLRVSLSCLGGDDLVVELWRSSGPLANWGTLTCGAVDIPLSLTAGSVYQLHFSLAAAPGTQVITYHLGIENLP